MRASLPVSGALVLALVGTGCGSSPGRSASSVSTTSSTGSTSTSTSSAPSSTTTSTSAPAVPVTLAVVACTTTVALGTPPAAKTLPATATLSVPKDQASYLAVYSDPAALLQMLGPRGWICKAAYGADGSGGLLLQPAGGEVVRGSNHLASTSTAEAIEGYQTGASTVQGASLACPVIAAAAAATRSALGQGCAAPPAAETLFPKSANDVAFFDPPGTPGTGSPSGGVNPANGVVLYAPGGGKSSAYLATCTLPAVQSAVCSTVLHYFVSLYG